MKAHIKGTILRIMKIKDLCVALLVLVIFSGCALITDEYQVNQKEIIAPIIEAIQHLSQILRNHTIAKDPVTRISG